MKSTKMRNSQVVRTIAAKSGARAALAAVEAEAIRENAVEVLRNWESQQARKQRGGCSSCGHTWRPRNPSINVNRCPGCQARGTVEYTEVKA